MPEVVTNGTTILATGVVAQQKPVNTHVTKAEIMTAQQAIAHASACGSMARKAKEAQDTALLTIFEKVLGVKTLDEVKALDSQAMANLLHKRIEDGAFTVENGADFDFAIPKGGERRNPKWKDLFIGKNGEAAAKQAEADTPVSHTWHVVSKTPPVKQ